MNETNSKRSGSRKAGLVLAAFALLLFTSFVYFQRSRKPVFPDETAAGLELLSSRFVGPGYFHLEHSVTNLTSYHSEPNYYLDLTDARKQISRVVEERNHPAIKTDELERLIVKLAEDPESRTVGTERVNVLRLNLALDELGQGAMKGDK